MATSSYQEEEDYENTFVEGDLDFEDPDLFTNVDLNRVSSSTYTPEESISKGLPDFGNDFTDNIWGYPTEDMLSMTTTAHNQKTTLLGSGLAKPSLSRNKSLESSVKSALQDMKGEEKKKNMMNVPCKPYLLTKFYFYTDEVDEMRIKEDIEEYFDEECRISYQFNGKQASWTAILYESNGPAFTNMTVNLYRSDNPLYSFIIECNRENGDYPLFKHFVWRMTGLSLVVGETIPKFFLKNMNNNSATSNIAPAVSNKGRSSSVGSNNTALSNIQQERISISSRVGEDSPSTLSRESMLESLKLVYSLATSPFLGSKMEASAILVAMSSDIHNENYLYEKNMLEAMFHLAQTSFTLDNGKEMTIPLVVRGNAILTLSNLSINLAKQETLLDNGIITVVKEMLFSMSQEASTASTNALEIKDLQRESLRILTNLSKRYGDRVLQELGHTVFQEWIECVDGYEDRDPIMCMHAKMARDAITMGLNTAIAT